jgi:arylsulfatase A-like enzyme
MRPPNVIVFLTDQQRWDTTGSHGNPLGLTPNFDRLAAEGTLLANTFTVQPVCGPSRACMQTSQYATQIGVFKNGIPLPQDVSTLAKAFKENGYQTGYIGKWHLASEEPVPASERAGYDFWLAANLLEFSSDAYNTVVYDADGKPQKLPGYRVDALTDAAIRFVNDRVHDSQDAPFFLFVSLLEPHHQNHVDDYIAPQGYQAPYQGAWLPPDLAALPSLYNSVQRHVAGYYGMVKRIDEAFGRLIDALESLNLMQDTITVFTSDHGCHFRTRNDEYKRSCHEASLRVPTLFTGHKFTGGGRVSELVTLLDLAPSVLDACGLDTPESFEGQSIVPLLAGEKGRDHVFFQISESEVGRGVRTKRWKYAVTALGHNGFEDAYADTYYEAYLYDLEHDPYELHNLVAYASHEEVRAWLRGVLEADIAKIEGVTCTIVPAESQGKVFFDNRVAVFSKDES